MKLSPPGAGSSISADQLLPAGRWRGEPRDSCPAIAEMLFGEIRFFRHRGRLWKAGRPDRVRGLVRARQVAGEPHRVARQDSPPPRRPRGRRCRRRDRSGRRCSRRRCARARGAPTTTVVTNADGLDWTSPKPFMLFAVAVRQSSSDCTKLRAQLTRRLKSV